jgi:two-component system, chemotaxis family, chemotaxis protein CheY
VTRGACILVVEDDENIRELVDVILSGAGYQVLTAPDGEAALQVIGSARPDLVLLDMRMPIMDGWEFARRYRARPEPHAPIVVLTAARDAAERAAEIHANGYLGKPFNIEELLTLVSHHACQA